MRPVFFVPWWWYLWSRGPRFSLRRLLGRAAACGILGAILAGAGTWAFLGRAGEPALAALRFLEYGTALGALWSLAEPLWLALSASLLARSVATATLRGVSAGLVLAYAALAGYAIYANAGHFATLALWLAQSRSADGTVFGNLRFITGATLVSLPIMFGVRAALIALDGTPLGPQAHQPAPVPPPRRDAVPPPAARTFMPPPSAGHAPQAYDVPKPPPARVIRSEAGPLRPPNDR